MTTFWRRTTAAVASAALALGLGALGATPATADAPTSGFAIGYPGLRPGAPSASVEAGTVSLGNAVVRASWRIDASGYQLDDVTAVGRGSLGLSGHRGLALVIGGATHRLADGTLTSPPTISDLAADADAPKRSHRDPGKAITATWRLTPASGPALDVQWRAVLRADSNYVQESWSVTPLDGSSSITDFVLLSADATNGRLDGRDDGYPVVLGASGAELGWVGVETPLSKASVDGGRATIHVPRSSAVTATAPGSYTIAYGVAPEGQIRRAFQFYFQRERAHERRPYLHYQSWFDLTPDPNGKLNIDPVGLADAIELFGSQLTSRGASLDSYWIDDGWDYLRDPAVSDESELMPWSLDPTHYPNGFAEHSALAERYGGSLSVWMRPFGGYGTSAARRAELNASKPADQRLETHGGYQFKLSGERYHAHFRNTIFGLMDRYDVQGFKFDGIGGGLYQRGPNETYRADYESLLSLTTEMRDHRADAWINATVGTYGSPYWMWYVDSIWRDGHDARMIGNGTGQQKYVNYRDAEVYKNFVTEAPLVPITSLMNHGFIFSTSTAGQVVDSVDLSREDVRKKVADDLRNYFAMGLELQELYTKHTIVDPERVGEANAEWFWDTLAHNAKWSREEFDLLEDTHWIGGDPAAGAIYGTAAWSAEDGAPKAMVMLRNPGKERISFPLELGRDLELPDGAPVRYRFSERDGQREGFVAEAGTVQHVTLEPMEVLLFEGTPTTDPVTDSTEVLPDPSLRPLSSCAFLTTTDSQETSGEDGRLANAFDGNPDTKWHTGYSSGVAPFPHHVTIDARDVLDVDKVTYLRRQDGASNGNIRDYELLASPDGTEWTTVASGSFPDDAGEQTIEVPEAHRTARYWQLRALNAHNGQAFAAAAEIALYGQRSATSPYLARDTWTASASSEETQGEPGRASNAIDCGVATYWHSQYNPTNPGLPQHLDIDLGGLATVEGLGYLGRQVRDANGTIGDYTISLSTDGQSWTPVADGTWTSATPDDVTFAPQLARFVRLEVRSTQNGRPFASAADVAIRGAYATVTPEAPTLDDQPGTGNDAYVIPEVANVRYLVNGNVLAPGRHPVAAGTQQVLVVAEPASGYRLAEGAVSEWTLVFDIAQEPTQEPTGEPTATPTAQPTAEPTAQPTAEPTAQPTAEPTAQPTAEPTAEPTLRPSSEPTVRPTGEPTVSAPPSVPRPGLPRTGR